MITTTGAKEISPCAVMKALTVAVSTASGYGCIGGFTLRRGPGLRSGPANAVTPSAPAMGSSTNPGNW